MKHSLILASGTVLALALASVPGCSSDDDTNTSTPNLTPSSGGSTSSAPGAAGRGNQTAAAAGSGSAAAGAGGSGEAPLPVMMLPQGAAGSSANAGNATGGSGGAPAAAGGSGGAAPALVEPSATCPAAAQSPSNGRPCTVTCTDDCGVQNVGTRLCTCTGAVFACASCDVDPTNPLYAPPTAAFANCLAIDADQENDESGCMDNQRCQSISDANRFCGCLDGEWDCDSKPDSFMF